MMSFPLFSLYVTCGDWYTPAQHALLHWPPSQNTRYLKHAQLLHASAYILCVHDSLQSHPAGSMNQKADTIFLLALLCKPVQHHTTTLLERNTARPEHTNSGMNTHV